MPTVRFSSVERSLLVVSDENGVRSPDAIAENMLIIRKDELERGIEISQLTAYSFDEYHEMVFAKELKKYEEEGGGDIGSEAYTQVADDLREIMIETKEGLRFTIRYYPSYDWIDVSTTMSYYKMSPEIKEWFEINIK